MSQFRFDFYGTSIWMSILARGLAGCVWRQILQNRVPMPRLKLERSDRLPYHVTARSNNREPFLMPMAELWELSCFQLHLTSIICGVEIHAFVLMPNHFHLLVTAPTSDLGVAMNFLIAGITQRFNRRLGRTGHLFGGPHHRSLIQSTRYFGHALKYIYRNPVRANLCQRVEEYPWSTLAGLLGSQHLPMPLHLTRVGMEISLPASEPVDQLPWLNRPFPGESEHLIRKGLRKRFFEDLKNRSTRMPYDELRELI